MNFNPRSREGSDAAAAIIVPIIARFQSTLPRRERRNFHAIFYGGINISIHAPAKGATIGALLIKKMPRYFNPRSREGSDIGRYLHTRQIGISIHAPAKGATTHILSVHRLELFQSTLPRRERRSAIALRNSAADFNPRSREGSDLSFYHLVRQRNISIHAPAKGATKKILNI